MRLIMEWELVHNCSTDTTERFHNRELDFSVIKNVHTVWVVTKSCFQQTQQASKPKQTGHLLTGNRCQWKLSSELLCRRFLEHAKDQIKWGPVVDTFRGQTWLTQRPAWLWSQPSSWSLHHKAYRHQTSPNVFGCIWQTTLLCWNPKSPKTI